MIEIRGMRWWDIPSVHALEERSFPHDSWTIEQFWQELGQPTRQYFVATGGEQVVGYAGIFVLPPDSDLQTIAVDPSERGSGVGALLLERAIDVARTQGAVAMVLEVRSDNEDAIRLYERAGFAPISRRSAYYPDGCDALIWRRRPLETP